MKFVSNLVCVLLLVLTYKMWSEDVKACLIIQAEETLFLRTVHQVFIERKPIRALNCMLWPKCLIPGF